MTCNLHENVYTFVTISREFFLEGVIFQTKIVEKIKTYFVLSNFFFRKLCRL
jgi:hypothetical protein